MDMITAADIRYCTSDATFCVKEVDLAIVADMGTLQRLPGIVGEGLQCKLCKLCTSECVLFSTCQSFTAACSFMYIAEGVKQKGSW